MAVFQVTAAVLIDIAAIIVGLASLKIVYGLHNTHVGVTKEAFRFMVAGVGFQILAILYTLTFVRFKIVSVPFGVDIHHLLMLVGLVCFVASFRKLVIVPKLVQQYGNGG